MSMEYIRKTYNIPAKRGKRIRFHGHDGVITGSLGCRLRARFGGISTALLHPTWDIEYLPDEENYSDSERLDWLMRTVSGAELRRMGIVYSAGCGRADVDRAMSEEKEPKP
jgi:hypothetical protein